MHFCTERDELPAAVADLLGKQVERAWIYAGSLFLLLEGRGMLHIEPVSSIGFDALGVHYGVARKDAQFPDEPALDMFVGRRLEGFQGAVVVFSGDVGICVKPHVIAMMRAR